MCDTVYTWGWSLNRIDSTFTLNTLF